MGTSVGTVVAAEPHPAGLSTPELESELLTLAGHLAAAHCRWLLLLAEFDGREAWAGPGLRSSAHWLSWRAGMNLRTAHDQVRVAKALPSLPLITAAFGAGRISYSKVRAITRIATPANERELLDLALAGTASHVERVVRLTRQVQADPDEVTAHRAVRWSWQDDGSLRLSARLTAEQGALLVAALEQRVPRPDPLTTSAAGRLAEERSAERGEESLRAGDGATQPVVSLESLAARRADALVELVAGAEKPQTRLVVHLNAETGTAAIENGPALPAETVGQLCCAGEARALVSDTRGNPLYLGRTHRLVKKKLMNVLLHRDQHRCRFPGCTSSRGLEAHHIRFWLHGGRTDVTNLLVLCERHHRLVHKRGFRITGTAAEPRFFQPGGIPIPEAGPPTEGTATALTSINAAQVIDDNSLTPTWGGERLDPTPLLLRLLPEPAPPHPADEAA